ncbi:MAG: peptidase S8 [Comamonadaceae bacterium]|nr:peptidase S8 [Comamonadaceae bacterium]
MNHMVRLFAGSVCMHADVTTGLRGALLGALLVASLTAHAASPKLGGRATPLATASAPLSAEPATRLIVRYKTAVKMAGQGGVTLATERREAAMRVARTAQLSGLPLLAYLKSVSPTLHVVALPQPLSPAETQAAIQRLREDEGVADVAIDHRLKPHLVPNDPQFGNGAQWHLMDSLTVPGGINAASAWDFSSGSGVVVAVLDTGYRPHADLAANVLSGYDFIGADGPSSKAGQLGQAYWTANDDNARDPDAQDPGDWVTQPDVTAGFCTKAEDSSWHGTHVAGIVAALGNNASDGLGVAYGARILPVRVLGRCGGHSSDILTGARWAAGLPVQGVPANPNPARILNLSLGVAGQPCDPGTQSVMDEIRAANVSIVASSGNDGSTTVSLPANCRGVLAVTAHTREGDNADYANVGAGVAISAPGGGANTRLATPTTGIRGVPSTWNTGTTVPANDAFAEMAGTSMAAPQVAGVLALLASLRPDLSMAALEGIVTSAVRPFPPGSYCAINPNGLTAGFCGSGLLDAQLAVAAATTHVAPSSSGGGSGGGGGGCTMAPGGRADAGLVLLALCALGVLAWRRRSMPQAVCPTNAP